MVLLLAACSQTPKAPPVQAVEYVSATHADGSPITTRGVPAPMIVRIQRDTITGRITLLLRELRGDSIVNSDVTALGGEDGKECAAFGTTSWTCTTQNGRWTFDNNELRYVLTGRANAMIFSPQPVTTP
jgi:hypothetical protein